MICAILLLLSATTGIIDASVDTIVRLSQPTYLTSCIQGLIDKHDKYIFYGSINTNGVNNSTRPKAYFESKSVNDTSYYSLCDFNINGPCRSDQNAVCYCKTNINSVLEVVFNKTTDIAVSQHMFRLNLPSDDPFKDDDVSLDHILPLIYSDALETLMIKGNALSVENCEVQLIPNSNISWCVRNLLSHTLTISINGIDTTSSTDCVDYTISTGLSATNFTFSFNELVGCKRNASYTCIITELTTTIPTTVNTTTATTGSCPSSCIAVIVSHGICTVLEAILTIIIIVILSEKTPLYITVPTCITLATLELAQIALVIVNGVQDAECECDTTVPLWGIMLIYQFGTNGIFIVADVVYLVIKISCNTSELLDKPWITVVIFICIHSVVGIIALPIVFIYKYSITASSKKISGDVPLNENGHDSTTRPEKENTSSRDPKSRKAKPSNSNVIDPEIKSKTEANAAPTNGEESSKGKKKKKGKRAKKQHIDNGEIDATSSTSGVEVHLKEPEESSGKINQTNQGVNSLKKRLPSVEITNNPNQIAPRPLPQSKGASELPPIQNK